MTSASQEPLPLVSFHVRTHDQMTLAEMAERVTRALGVDLVPSTSHMFRETHALEGSCLGMWITLSYWPPSEEGQPRRYQVAGESAEDVRKEWTHRVDISDFVAEVLCRRDRRAWYVPTLDELKRDVMLDQ